MSTLHAFIGWDAREIQAYNVCRWSMIRRASQPVLALPLSQKGLKEIGLYQRKWHVDQEGQYWDDVDGKPFSTEFSFTRFLVPELARRAGLTGWVLFCDCDMLFQEDIHKIFTMPLNPEKALYVVPHNYKSDGIKMDNKVQESYSRKLWSAFMLFNMSHPSNSELGTSEVNTWTGARLHYLDWLLDHEIGYLDEEWHWINDASPTIERSSKVMRIPKVIHYTRGGPWFDSYRHCREHQAWDAELDHYKAAHSTDRLPGMRLAT